MYIPSPESFRPATLTFSKALSVYLPGVDGGDIWDLHNPNLYFAEELFSNSTANVHACIPEALAKMIGIKDLTIGYTKDIELGEKIARATGAQNLAIETRPEGDTLLLNSEEQAEWISRGWALDGRTARKTLVASMEDEKGKRIDEKKDEWQKRGHQSYSEGGRLMANMLFETSGKSSRKKEDDTSVSEDEDTSVSEDEDMSVCQADDEADDE